MRLCEAMPDRASPSDAGPTSREAVPIGEKLRVLTDPASYPGDETTVEVKETHFSYVFLTRRHVYKLKKPVRNGAFDFRSIAARRRNSLAEVRLNRRLSSGIYLGVVPLCRDGRGLLRLGNGGEPVDWLVRMVRLDSDSMLDRRLAAGNWRYAELEALAHRLAGFFATARLVRISGVAYTCGLHRELDHALAVLEEANSPGLRHAFAVLIRRLRAFVVRRRELFFEARAAQGRIVDGHGDLRPEHIHLSGSPQIIDCLEFSDDLRRLDPVSEIAFLALECGRIGATPIETRLLRRYRERRGDDFPAELLAFYKALNAITRARLAVQHIAEPGMRTRQEWLNRAASYLEIAQAQLPKLSPRRGEST